MQEGAEGGTMLVYPQRRPSAMRCHCFQSKRLQRHFHFCLILSLRHSDWKTQPHRFWLGWVFLKNASSFRQFSTRRQAKRKRVSHLLVPEYIHLELKSAHETPGHFQGTQHSEGRRPALRSQQVRGAAGQDLVRMSSHPAITLHAFPSSVLEVDKS